MRFAPRSSGQITFALGFDVPKGVVQDLFVKPGLIKSGKSLAPGRAAGGIFKLAASGGKASCIAMKYPGQAPPSK